MREGHENHEGGTRARESSKPPNDDEEPKDDDEKQHVTHPPPSLAFRHSIHAPERTA